MSDKFILNDKKEVVEVDDLMEWAAWMEKRESIVKQEMIGDKKVSTVFLGLDHSFGEGEPILWETMVFPECTEMDRCGGTIEDAKTMHERMCAKVRGAT